MVPALKINHAARQTVDRRTVGFDGWLWVDALKESCFIEFLTQTRIRDILRP
jgi:hypothetical protein